MKKLMVLGLVAGFAAMVFGGTANTWHVAKSGNDSTGDGSAGNPYLTIQKGVDRAAAGDTVLVDDGDYSDIGRELNFTNPANFTVPTVVVIDKQITLKSKNGKGSTFITGAWGNGTAQDGSDKTFPDTGVGAHRCVYSTGGGTVIQGFTIRKGATVRAGTGVNNDVDLGGGVVAGGGTVYLLDCEVLDCRAGEGAAVSRDVRPCRCRFAGNCAKGDSQVAYRNSYAFNCLYENNGRAFSATDPNCGMIFTYVQSFTAVNCTFLNNKVWYVGKVNAAKGLKMKLYNCLVFDKPATTVNLDLGYLDFRNCVQNVAGGHMADFAAQGCVEGVSKYLQCYSPGDDDWSACEGNSIVGKGDASLVTSAVTGLPAEYLATDFTGKNARTAADGSVSVGCYEPQAVKAPAAGRVILEENVEMVADGATHAHAAANRWTAVAKKNQVRIRYAGGGEVCRFTVKCSGDALAYTTSRFPDNGTDRGFWLTPPGSADVTVTAVPATDVKWVDDDADAAVADGSEEKPYKTIPAALAAISEDGVVKVKPGTYATDTMSGSNPFSSAQSVTCRFALTKNVAVRSTDGAAATVLKGGSDVTAIVLVPGSPSPSAQVQGFTLTGCAQDPTYQADQRETGMAFCAKCLSESARGVSEFVHLTDSVISNNVSSSRAVAGGWLERCLLVDNFTTVANMNLKTGGNRGTQAFGSILSGCVSYYSPQFYAQDSRPTVCTCAHQNATTLNCTLYVPASDALGQNYRIANVPNGRTVCINNAMISPVYDTYSPDAERYAGGNLTSPGAEASPWLKSIPVGTYYFDAANHDYRPIAGSAGLAASELAADKWARYEVGDFNGKPLAYETYGKPIPGAFQVPVKQLLVLALDGRGTVEPSGVINVTDGEQLTFKTTPQNHRFLGWLVDGVTNLTSETTFVYTVDMSHAALSLSPLYSSDLYANAAAADDSGDGLTPATAKKTLAAFAEIAVAGDTIHAAKGDYNDGEYDMNGVYKAAIFGHNTQLPLVRVRAYLPQGVSLVSDEGAEVTFITGKDDPNGETWNNVHYSLVGANAIRCVVGLAGSRVRGFTIRNGRTRGKSGGPDDVNAGGCVLAPRYDPASGVAGTILVEDCVIRDGIARNGANVAGGCCVRCKLLDGVSFSGAGGVAAVYARLENCLVNRGKAGDTSLLSPRGIYNCTVYATGTGASWELGEASNAQSSYPIVNSVICVGGCNKSDASYSLVNVTNCFVRITGGRPALDLTKCRDVTVLSNYNDLLFNSDHSPTKNSPVLDAGDRAFLADCLGGAEADLDGGSRVYNAQVDCGCYEYDWRTDYAAALGDGRRTTVEAAGPDVVQADSGDAVTILDGELRASWRCRGAEAVMGVDVKGEGTLTLYRGDEVFGTFTKSTAEKTVTLDPTADVELLRFVYEKASDDTDGAVLSGFKRNSGMCILVK